MNRIAFLARAIEVAGIAILLAGCVTIDRNAAASLGAAGESATQAISAQASGALTTLGNLNQWWGVRDTLVCRSIKIDLTANAMEQTNAKAKRVTCITHATSEVEEPAVKQLVDILGKRKQAINTLGQAYSSFSDLAHYNAGEEATKTLQTSFSDINSFLGAISALPGAAIAPISTTIEKVATGVIGLAADSRQNTQILAANTDLQTANVALVAGLTKEQAVMTGLLVMLQDEREDLYKNAFETGLIDPLDILNPIFNQAYAGITLRQPIAENADVVMAAAEQVRSFQDRQTNAAIGRSYSGAVAALKALEAQHQKLGMKQSPRLTAIQAEVSNLRADTAQVGRSAAATQAK